MKFRAPSVFCLAGLACLALSLSLGRAAASAAPAPAAAPAARPKFDANSDRGRMLTLLGLPVPPPRAAASNTTDESKARPANSKYPDPLVLNNGSPVKDAATWWNLRRNEIFEDFARDVYGRIPPNTPKVTWEVAKSEDDGQVKTKTIIGHIDNSRYPALSPTIALTVKTPSDSSGPVPTIVYAQAFGGRMPAGPNQLEVLTLAKGWGYATFDTNAVQPDSAAGLTQGIIGLMNKGEMRAKPDEWGVLMAWAWGLSKSIDYFETDRDVNAKQLAIDGFSRWGKTAMLAAAVDRRWALAWAGDSGEGGTKMHRRNFGETVDMVAQNFPYWMAGNFQKFVGNWEAMPVDSHELIALVAPRPVFITGGTTDLHADARGMFEAAALAGPVYELLGRKGVGTSEMPLADVALISGDIGYRMHTGAHTPVPDYGTFLEFCSKYFEAPQR